MWEWDMKDTWRDELLTVGLSYTFALDEWTIQSN